MKPVMVTGARAPVALELCRMLSAEGIEVYAADSLRFPLARWSSSKTSYVRLPAPARGLGAYAEAVSEAVRAFGIGHVIPTCEEVFHLSIARDRGLLPGGLDLFAPEPGLLLRMHDKYRIQELAAGLSVVLPETQLVARSSAMLKAVRNRRVNGKQVEKLVVKKVFSRFASDVLVDPGEQDIETVIPSSSSPWIVQEFVPGQEICTYAVAVRGEVHAFAAYAPGYRAGSGAGTMFIPVDVPEVEAFVSDFVRKHGVTGQFGFDVILGPDGPALLECNPRSTSGLHLLRGAISWRSVLSGESPRAGSRRPDQMMIGLATAVSAATRGASGGFRGALADLRSAKDVIWSPSDPLPAFGQALSMLEIVARGAARGVSPVRATTMDIEFNG